MNNEPVTPDETVDSRGAACPGPLMDLIGAIRDADTGTVVMLQSDNEQSRTDVPEWADETDHELLHVREAQDHYEFYVEVS